MQPQGKINVLFYSLDLFDINISINPQGIILNKHFFRFTGAKLQEMRNAFGLFDRDGDGSISLKVIIGLLKMLFKCGLRSWPR